MDVIRVLALMSDAGLRMTPSQFAEHATIRAQAALLQREPLSSAPFGSAPFPSAPASPAPVAALPPTSLPDAMVADEDHTAPATKVRSGRIAAGPSDQSEHPHHPTGVILSAAKVPRRSFV